MWRAFVCAIAIVIVTQVLAFLEVSTVGTKSSKAPQRRANTSKFMSKQQFVSSGGGGGSDDDDGNGVAGNGSSSYA